MRIALVGCTHGELDVFYHLLATQNEELAASKKPLIELVICCGDFQAVRNRHDLSSMSVPDKYKKMGDFAQYYNGVKQAPIPTIVIGGNHECSSYFSELFHGGWLAPNIYYLGNAGSIMVNGKVKVRGLSGIFKEHDFTKEFFETPPYSPRELRSVYHTRSVSVEKMKLLAANDSPGSTDVFVSHDWPVDIAYYGDKDALLRKKPFFAKEVESHTLGSPYHTQLLSRFEPKYWCAAHLHVKFFAKVPHEMRETQFIALDKPKPKSLDFIHIIDVGCDSNTGKPDGTFFEYDPLWLAVLRSTARDALRSIYNIDLNAWNESFPSSLEWVRRNVSNLRVDNVQHFAQTMPPSGPVSHTGYRNPQTQELCDYLEIPNTISPDALDLNKHLQEEKEKLLKSLDL